MKEITVEQALDRLSGHYDAEFLTIFKSLGYALGYRTLGRALASDGKPGAVKPESNAAGASYCPECADKRRRATTRRKCRGEYKPMTFARAKKIAPWHPTREEVKAILARPSVSKLVKWYEVDATRDGVIDNYLPRECCGARMGVMESFDGGKAVYQCAVNPEHHQPARKIDKPERIDVFARARGWLDGYWKTIATAGPEHGDDYLPYMVDGRGREADFVWTEEWQAVAA